MSEEKYAAKDLIGFKETAAMLGWDPRMVSVYRSRGVFPEPIAEIAAGPIWTRQQIEAYKESRRKIKEVKYYPFIIKGDKADEAAEELDIEERNLDRLYEGIAPSSDGYLQAREKIRKKIQEKYDVTFE
jgi:hypothetical protein